ncbi:UNVERIFIED_CONTAM: hypothetical protein FKN15_042732 [Acipenser sinensis]
MSPSTQEQLSNAIDPVAEEGKADGGSIFGSTVADEDATCLNSNSSGELKVQRESSDPTNEPASSSTPRNPRADVSELPDKASPVGVHLSLLGRLAGKVHYSEMRRNSPAGFDSLTNGSSRANATLPLEIPTKTTDFAQTGQEPALP